jgi:hypothetical protein
MVGTVSLLLLFRRGYGDWPERAEAAAETPATPQQDRLLFAPKMEDVRRPLGTRRRLTKLR